MTDNKQLPAKPIPLRIIFILNALMCILPFIFYFVITTKEIEIGGLNPIGMVYTGIAYIVSFIFLVRFILKRNCNGIRTILVLNILIAIPMKAYIGILFALISLGLTFHKKVKEYFLVN